MGGGSIAQMNGGEGRWGNTSPSPSSSSYPSPQLANSSLPRIKLNIRPNTNPTSPASSSKVHNSQPLKTYSKTSKSKSSHPHPINHNGYKSDSSELTPASSDDDDEDMEGRGITPRMIKSKIHSQGQDRDTPTKSEKGKGKKRSSLGAAGVVGQGKAKGKGEVGIQKGREKKRSSKNGERQRRRERDEKMGGMDGEDYVMQTPISRPPRSPSHSDGESSYGDDDMSDIEQTAPPLLSQLGKEQNADAHALPDAFVGQEVEDLAYGAGGGDEVDMERAALSGWWNNQEEDDDEMFITHLSGSEAERQSQSSAHESEEDDSMSDGSASSSTDNEVDEFGFPQPAVSTNDAPLVLIQGWDGKFELVPLRPEKETSRTRSRRADGSRRDSAGASTSGSTLADNGGLIIDADANDGEFDTDSESFWSGMSDDEGGDTTDSMAEEDMPMLDSPALQQLIDDQMGGVVGVCGVAVNGSSGMVDGSGGPAIVITDTTTPFSSLVHTAVPTTPGPLMGTFHPITNHPSQHAVVDGSKVPIVSPFTHKRRTGSSTTRSVRGQSTISTHTHTQRKRKSSISTSLPPHSQAHDPFSPSLPLVMGIPKRARYSSIPGHPVYIKAKRAAAIIEGCEETESEEEEVEEEGGVAEIDLEDMLETSLLHAGHYDEGDGEGEEGEGFRFDRVPVSTYLRRHFRSGGGEVEYQYGGGGAGGAGWGSPVINRRGGGMGGRGGMEDTLVGGGLVWRGRGMGEIISPLLEPLGRMVPVQEEEVTSRREKRRGRKRVVAEDLGVGMPALRI